MTAKTLLIAAGAFVAFSAAPALAGGGCASSGHASVPDVVVDAVQSTPADAQTYTSIPYPLPTLTDDTQTAAVEGEADSTSTE